MHCSNCSRDAFGFEPGLELGDLTGVDADIAAYARVADRLRSPTYSWLVPMWLGMRAVLDGDLDAGDRYAEEVATLAQAAQSPNAEMMAWTLSWRVARLRQDSRAIRELAGRMVAPGRRRSRRRSCTFALLYAESGDSERGRRHLRRVMDAGLDSLPVDSEWVEMLWLLGEAAMLLDEREADQRRPLTPSSRTRTAGRSTATAGPASAGSPTCSPVSPST